MMAIYLFGLEVLHAAGHLVGERDEILVRERVLVELGESPAAARPLPAKLDRTLVRRRRRRRHAPQLAHYNNPKLVLDKSLKISINRKTAF